MKLFIKRIKDTKGQDAFVLCDEQGKEVGQQRGSVFSCEVGKRPTITVTFYVDGKTIGFE